VQAEDVTLCSRGKGSPQGSVISPLLANLFLHYAFDEWVRRNYKSIPFERYADDILAHCKSKDQAKWIKKLIEERLKQCGLELHPEKTKIVYCKDSFRQGNHANEKFDFLGYRFRPRLSKDRYGKFFVSFLPAVSDEVAKSIRRTIRGWRIHRMTDKSLKDLAFMFNSVIRGWINYYGQFYKSALYPIFNQLNGALQRWAMRNYKKLRRRRRRAFHWLGRIAKEKSYLFAHWRLVRQSAGR
jgi:RNA-directed DNA polymerase